MGYTNVGTGGHKCGYAIVGTAIVDRCHNRDLRVRWLCKNRGYDKRGDVSGLYSREAGLGEFGGAASC